MTPQVPWTSNVEATELGLDIQEAEGLELAHAPNPDHVGADERESTVFGESHERFSEAVATSSLEGYWAHQSQGILRGRKFGFKGTFIFKFYFSFLNEVSFI